MRFDENLRSLRKEKDYSQEYLAERLGVTRQTISKWENATAMPDLKKLTEIADFFEVSMDTLLGMEFADNDDNNTDSKDSEQYQRQYAEQLFSVVCQNQAEQNRANQKAVKVLAIVFSVAVVCVIFALISFSNRLNNEMQNMQNQINWLAERIDSRQNYDDYSNSNEFEYEFLSVDKEKNYMVNTELKYLPSTYPKNASVYFLVINKDGTTQRIDATEDNGVFVAAADIDVTAAQSGYVYIDDGEVITREELFYGFETDNFIYFESDYIYNEGSDIYLKDETKIKWSINSTGITKISDAYLVYGTEDNEQKLKIEKLTEDDNDYYVVNSSIERVWYYESKCYLKLIDENGIIYKFYLGTESAEIAFSDNKVIKEYY